ncbi:hypothetical protein E7V67_006295 [[Empedobacter] haloabium]|uniref:Lytic transglycosylase domain-containing protein n=1 Tax=[Empedobacter] haloabium TaxID=592317 RepID=A0ABZ1URP8_9BURK
MPDYDKLAAKFGGSAADAGDAPDKYDQMAQKFSGSVAGAASVATARPQGVGDLIADLPRQGGLTARHTIEGLGRTFDTIIGNPLRTLASPIFGNAPRADTGVALADLVGLPKPQTAGERIVGDIASTVAGGVLPIGLGASLASRSTGITAGVGRALAASPAKQLTGAAAAGAAGGYTREAGGTPGEQMLASIVAGVGAPFALGAAGRVGQAAARVAGRGPQIDPGRIDSTINSALESAGMQLDDLPAGVAQRIRADVAEVVRGGGQASPLAVRRLVDYRLTGARPTAAGLADDPGIFTRQKNLAKVGANLKDRAAQELAQVEHQNNRALTAGLDDLGAVAAPDAYDGAQRIMGALADRNARAQQVIGSLYDRARDSAGRSAALDPHAFTQRAGDLLNDANVESFLTPDIRNKLNAFATGETPLTVDIAEQFKTGLGRIQRSSTDGNARHALGLVRQALDDTPLLQQAPPAQAFGGQQLTVPGAVAGAQTGNVGREAIDAFNKARAMNRSWMQIVESTPALQAVRDGIEPDQFVQRFILGQGGKANVMDVAKLKSSIKASPEAMTAVREQILGHLKSKALNGAADEGANFSQAGYNKALNAIGDRKLRLFFEPAEIAQIKAIGRVARYEQVQPAGSAVNNSNTRGAFAVTAERLLNAGVSMLPKIPGYAALVQPSVNEILVGQQASRAFNVPRALLMKPPPMLPGSRGQVPLLPPAALLGTETEERRRQREAGLFLP